MCAEKSSKEGFLARCVKDQQVFIFEEMFWIIFELFDAIWTKRQTLWNIIDETDNETQHYFKFGEIISELKTVVTKTLAKNPNNYATFKVRINLIFSILHDTKYLLDFEGIYDYKPL